MSGRRGGWLSLLCSAAAVAQAEPPRAFVEVDLSTEQPWLQQPVEVVVRVGIDTAFFTAFAVPMLAQRLDQPFVLTVPWSMPESLQVTAVPASDGSRVAVGDRVLRFSIAGSRTIDGREFDLLELKYRCVPLLVGAVTLPPVRLRFQYAQRFEPHFLRGREPVGVQEVSIESAARTLAVRALPPAPPGFDGAVGEFNVAASVTGAEVRVGEAFDLEVRVRGDGNLDQFPAPRWPELPGFVVQGLVERRTPAARSFVFDVLPLRALLKVVPAVSFVAFSPQQQRYVTLATQPLPLTVAPAADLASLPPRVQQLIAADRERADARPWWHYAAIGASVALAGGLWLRGRRNARRRALLQAAAERVQAAVSRDPTAAAKELEQLCCLGLGLSTFDAQRVADTMRQLGADASLLGQVQGLQAKFEAARFGGPAPAAADVAAVLHAFVQFCRRAGR